MNHERHRRNDDKHHGRNRIEEEAELDDEILGELQPGDIEDLILQTHRIGRDKLGIAAEEVGECDDIRHYQHCSQTETAECAGELRAHLRAEKTEEEEHEQRNDENEQW